MEAFVLAIYLLSLLFIFLFSLGQLHLTWHYRRSKDLQSSKDSPTDANLPKVTVQLPVFNEKYVAQRLVENIVKLDYPSDKLEIQVLDDSTDETRNILENEVGKWANSGVDIRYIHRDDRSGFKAGALQNGLSQASGEFIAIFDADFVPSPSFLRRTLPHFSENIGVVQSRWGHLNREYSVLTRLQAFGLDAHFTVEQRGRSAAGSFINFNGTAGVWRKSCITDAGGWSADTLTEDLDLSYRAQLKGWKFKFLETLEAPAELPVLMTAVKSQQYRWNKGAAETARKNLMRVLTAPLKSSSKFHAFFHLLNSSVFIALLLAAVLSVPVLFIKQDHPEWQPFFYAGGVFLIGFFSIAWFYWTSVSRLFPEQRKRIFFRDFPLFLIVTMGLSLHNGLAVIEGLLGRKTPFLRTPKFNVTQAHKSWQRNSYVNLKLSLNTVIEALLTIYFIAGIYFGIKLGDGGLLIFHIMLALGFGFVFIQSVFQPNGRSAA